MGVIRQKKWQQYTKEELELFVRTSHSYRDVADKIGYAGTGKNAVIRQMIEELNIDATHLNHNARKGKFDYSRFTYGKILRGSSALPAIMAIRGHKCEKCGLEIWNEQPIALEIHHIDGDKLNNNLDNLQLLCPNCHATTPNWRRKTTQTTDTDYVSDDDIIKALQFESSSIRQILARVGLSDHGSNYKRIKGIANKIGVILPLQLKNHNYCVDCGKEVDIHSTRCVKCNNDLIVQNWFESHDINREQLKEMIRTMPFTKIGDRFQVSDTTIKKWCKKFNLPHLKKDIQSISDDEWKLI